MARLTVSLALLLTGLTTSAAHAQDQPADDSESVAAEAGVSLQDLQDAIATLQAAGYRQVSARDYLISTGELAPAPAPAAVWQRLADCESGGDWHAVSRNGLYFGGLQEDLTFWSDYGGHAYAARPDLASPAAQIAVAIRGQAVQGWQSWPVCGRRLGLY